MIGELVWIIQGFIVSSIAEKAVPKANFDALDFR